MLNNKNTLYNQYKTKKKSIIDVNLQKYSKIDKNDRYTLYLI